MTHQTTPGKRVSPSLPAECYNEFINTKFSVEQLIAIFLKRGGRIDNYYLQGSNKNKHTIIYLGGWFGGKNMREALLKALV